MPLLAACFKIKEFVHVCVCLCVCDRGIKTVRVQQSGFYCLRIHGSLCVSICEFEIKGRQHFGFSEVVLICQ